MKSTTDEPRRRRRSDAFYAGFFLLVTVIVAGGGYVALRRTQAKRIYTALKARSSGWHGRAHEADPELGFAPIPGGHAVQLFPQGLEIPMRFDDLGFRVPAGEDRKVAGAPELPRVLTLGDSFTYGDASPAEAAFPYRLRALLPAATMNAGVCSYGLSQIYLRGERLIARHRPAHVVVQYSPWLVDRSMWMYSATTFGLIPVPYFADTREGPLRIVPPAFATRQLSVPFNGYRETPRSLVDFMGFYFGSALPLFVYDDLNQLVSNLKIAVLLQPPATENRAAILRLVYGGLRKASDAVGARMWIVGLGAPNPADVAVLRETLPDVPFIDTERVLRARIAPGEEAYRAAYMNWRGTPPVIIDPHPNAAAHAIFADELARAMRPELGAHTAAAAISPR